MFETIWRNKHIAPDREEPTLGDLIASLEAAVVELKKMREAGVTLNDADTAGDYYFLRTDDPKVARKFGMERAEESAE
jgi:hypothetical protein